MHQRRIARSRRLGRPGRRAAVLGWSLLALACAPLQPVPLDVEPSSAQLFLDGEAIDGRPAVIELRADRDHKLYFKRSGYKPELVVLRSLSQPDGVRLDPPEVRVRLRPLSPGGSQIEIERESPAPLEQEQ